MRSGEIRTLEGRTPFVLDDPEVGWIVRDGRVDVFAVELADGRPAGRRHPVCGAAAGDLLLGVEPTGALTLIGVGVAPASVERVALAEVAGDGDGPALVEQWAERLASGVHAPYEAEAVTLVAGESVELGAGVQARVARGTAWVDAAGLELLGAPATGWVPVPPGAWVEATAPVALTPVTAAEALAHGSAGLGSFGRAVLARVVAEVAAAGAASERRLARIAELDTELSTKVYGELAGVVLAGSAQVAATDEGALLAACRLVGAATHCDVVEPARGALLAARDPLEAIAQASGLRTRAVTLESGWWRRDAGPLLATAAEGGRPVALVPRRPGRYDLIDPQARTRTRVDRDVAATLAPQAHVFYRPLPPRPLAGRDLLRFALRDGRRDVARLLGLGLAVSLLSLVPPIVAGVLFEDVVPARDEDRLIGLTLLLVAVALGAAAFTVVQGIAWLRFEGVVSTSLLAAIWDRLLSLPVPFFRGYTSGDLTTRALGVDVIRDTLSRAMTVTVLAGFVILANGALMIVFDPLLGIVAVAIIVLAVAVILLIGRSILPHQRRLQEMRGREYGTAAQLFGGISKLRVARAEARAFAVWGHWFARMKESFFRAQRRYIVMTAFSASWPLLGTALIFIVAAGLPGRTITAGAFLAFNTAFAQVVAAILRLGTAVVSVVGTIPVWERTRPIFAAVPEAERTKLDPGRLRGAIDLSEVSFRYGADGPPVLDEVTLRAAPGEFVALVGPSGSGKSTLLRLLLGFEQPETGTVEYDGKDLGHLDVRAVRKQMGVVVQNARLLPGSIFQNITGSSPLLTIDDAWEAARTAGLEDDIRAMPMGMQTFISEGGAAFSGGQRQRILIARAVAAKPHILLFDEATSALDNRTQASVTASLERLRATRIVIAHRLSTIRGADQILVLDGGRVVQRGTYAELAERAGPFAELARRQLA